MERKIAKALKSSEALWPIESMSLVMNFAFVDKIRGHKNRGRKGYTPSVPLKCQLLIPFSICPVIPFLVNPAMMCGRGREVAPNHR